MDLPNLAKVAEHNRLAVERSDRPLVTCCTGRPLPFADAMCRLIRNQTVPCIAENGVWLYHPGENLYLRDPAITPEHLEMVHDASRWVELEFAAHGVTLQPGKTASVTLYHPDPKYLESICPAIDAEFARRDWPFRVSMTWFYINCDLKHVSKASGIRRLLAETGHDPARIAGIGDTLSDKAIADSVAWFACPANSLDEVKTWADYVSPHEQAVGVVDILERMSQVE